MRLRLLAALVVALVMLVIVVRAHLILAIPLSFIATCVWCATLHIWCKQADAARRKEARRRRRVSAAEFEAELEAVRSEAMHSLRSSALRPISSYPPPANDTAASLPGRSRARRVA